MSSLNLNKDINVYLSKFMTDNDICSYSMTNKNNHYDLREEMNIKYNDLQTKTYSIYLEIKEKINYLNKMNKIIGFLRVRCYNIDDIIDMDDVNFDIGEYYEKFNDIEFDFFSSGEFSVRLYNSLIDIGRYINITIYNIMEWERDIVELEMEYLN